MWHNIQFLYVFLILVSHIDTISKNDAMVLKKLQKKNKRNFEYKNIFIEL